MEADWKLEGRKEKEEVGGREGGKQEKGRKKYMQKQLLPQMR